jgi:hypothetical protein
MFAQLELDVFSARGESANVPICRAIRYIAISQFMALRIELF